MKTSAKAVIGNKEIIIETGRLAKQADGAVTVSCGDTVVLVTAVMSRQAKEDTDFFPLMVDYRERTYAAGRIPGGYFKREGRPTEREILTARLIDRPIRPLFPEGMSNEVQIMAMVVSSDGENDPDILSVIGASSAVQLSGIPYLGPFGAVRIARVEGDFVVNPTYAELCESDIDIVVCAGKEGILMIESGSKEVPEDVFLKAIDLGFAQCQKCIALQNELAKGLKKKELTASIKVPEASLIEKLKNMASSRIAQINSVPVKEERIEMMGALSKEIIGQLVTEGGEINAADIMTALNDIEKKIVRDMILLQKKRVDKRSFDGIRNIESEVGVLPRTHGSSLFTRGQTQSLSVVTLGTGSDEQSIEALEGDWKKTFMLHYNFPPFSVGEAKPVRGVGRREVGHGALAERALKPVIPSKEQFPYTVRIVSDVLESNGSSSMATVCAGSLALMDAGVPIIRAVAGIAIGVVKEGDNYVVLTDIAGLEDHYGDMDFKVAGTSKGITALQVDVKLKSGITMDIVKDAIDAAKKARIKILDNMNKAISVPKSSLSQYAPRIETIKISTDKIKDVIGPGGKVIKKIIADTGVDINVDDDGTINVASNDPEALKKAMDIIAKIVEEPEVGKIYKATVKRIMNFGAFCEILPGKEGLCHVSELSDEYVKNVESIVKLGDEITVKLVEIDEQGRLNLSRKKAMPKSGKNA
ncbi:MAG: polyribonucleotide nucleotidyltransferase [Candidatus Omnitrophica bacterium]|nr:polyribonucleotide nucleotidyltransferase [Candidatus Omnitrophota bacterium]